MNQFNTLPDEFQELLGPTLYLLKVASIRFLSSKSISPLRIAYFVLQKTSAFVFFIFCTLYFLSKSKIKERSMEFTEFAFALPSYFMVIEATAKSLNLLYKRAKIEDLLLELGVFWSAENLNDAQVAIKAQMLKRFNVFFKVYYGLNIISLIGFGFQPLIAALLRKFVFNEEFPMLLPYSFSCPVDLQENWIIYAMFYIFQFYVLFTLIIFYTSSECLTASLLVAISTQFFLLQEEFHKEQPDTKLTDGAVSDTETRQRNSEESLKTIIRKHQKLIYLSEQLDDVFNNTIFIFLFTTTVCIGVLGFLGKISHDNTVKVLGYMGIIDYLLPLLNLCYFVDLLIESSGGIADAAYNTEWYKESKSYKKMLLILITRAQRPCTLTALKYKPIALTTFTSVLSTAWSYFSLLITVYDSNK